MMNRNCELKKDGKVSFRQRKNEIVFGCFVIRGGSVTNRIEKSSSPKKHKKIKVLIEIVFIFFFAGAFHERVIRNNETKEIYVEEFSELSQLHNFSSVRMFTPKKLWKIASIERNSFQVKKSEMGDLEVNVNRSKDLLVKCQDYASLSEENSFLIHCITIKSFVG